MEKVYTTRYVARTALGKRLYIMAETKAMNSGGGTVASYSLTEDLIDASKCINKITAKTLISDYITAKNSTRTFKIIPVSVSFELLEDCDE